MPGRLIAILDGHRAFVPNDLPPQIAWDDELVLATSRADRAVALLAGVGEHLENPHVMIHPFLRREAVLSSRIEGTVTSLSELLLSEAEDEDDAEREPQRPTDPLSADREEVRNYVRALEHGLEELRQDKPLILRFVRERHRILMEGVRGDDKAPGEFRRLQVHIGGSRSQIQRCAVCSTAPGSTAGRSEGPRGVHQ